MNKKKEFITGAVIVSLATTASAPFFAGYLLSHLSAQNILLIFTTLFWITLVPLVYVYRRS